MLENLGSGVSRAPPLRNACVPTMCWVLPMAPHRRGVGDDTVTAVCGLSLAARIAQITRAEAPGRKLRAFEGRVLVGEEERMFPGAQMAGKVTELALKDQEGPGHLQGREVLSGQGVPSARVQGQDSPRGPDSQAGGSRVIHPRVLSVQGERCTLAPTSIPWGCPAQCPVHCRARQGAGLPCALG